MDLFRRKEYSFETPEIQKWLKGWLKTEKWSITDVVHFLQVNYNLEMPIHFANYDVLHATVDCIPVTGNPVVLQYYRKLPRDQVRIIVGDTTYCYNLGTKPNATLVGRVIKKADGSSIHAKYRSHDYTYKMYDDNLASEYRIRLFITDSEEFRENPDHQIIKYTDSIEACLLNCKEKDAVSVYQRVCEIIGFDYREIDNIHVTYNLPEGVIATEMTITEIEVEHGKIISCEAYKGKKRYKTTLSDELWSWEYVDPEQSIHFEFTQERVDNTEEAQREIETDVRGEQGYEINPETLDNVLSEITQTISKLLEIMG